MMKIKWGIPICLLMVLLILGFFARAEIQNHLVGQETGKEEKRLFIGGQVDIYFNENKITNSLPLPSYSMMAVAPVNSDWKEKTIKPLVQYLKKNNEKVLSITGHFLKEESEIQLGGYHNLGEARAGVLKQELIEAGIAAPRILIDYAYIDDQANTQKLPFEFEYFNDSSIIP